MTGPEHYRMAESLVERAGTRGTEFTAVTALTQLAQVHATLALAAATALAKFPGSADSDTFYGRQTREWAAATA